MKQCLNQNTDKMSVLERGLESLFTYASASAFAGMAAAGTGAGIGAGAGSAASTEAINLNEEVMSVYERTLNTS